MDLSELSGLQGGLQVTREPETMLFPPNTSRKEVLPVISTAPSKTVEFLYLDQETMIAAGVLNMPQAIDVVGQAQALLAEGLVRQPHKVVLRNEETARSEEE